MASINRPGELPWARPAVRHANGRVPRRTCRLYPVCLPLCPSPTVATPTPYYDVIASRERRRGPQGDHSVAWRWGLTRGRPVQARGASPVYYISVPSRVGGWLRSRHQRKG